MMKTLSIVVQSRGDAALLNRLLLSLSEQDYPAELIEIIVAQTREKLATKQLVRWWNSRAATGLPGNPEIRYRVAGEESFALDMVRYASGSLVVFVDESFEAHPHWAVQGVSTLASDHARGRFPDSTLVDGRFRLRHALLRDGEGDVSRLVSAGRSFSILEKAVRRSSPASYGREYLALVLLLVTLTCAVLGELRVALAALVGWCAMTLWLGVSLLQAGVRHPGGWRGALGLRSREVASADVRPIGHFVNAKESLDGTQTRS
jgi:hypothetical protein